jgi:hypothetical protein
MNVEKAGPTLPVHGTVDTSPKALNGDDLLNLKAVNHLSHFKNPLRASRRHVVLSFSSLNATRSWIPQLLAQVSVAKRLLADYAPWQAVIQITSAIS